MRWIVRGVIGAVVATVVSSGAAYADVSPDAPVTADDSVSLMAGDAKIVDVLANDTSPGDNPLKVCDVTGVPRALDAEIDTYDNEVFVGAAGGAGSYSFTYWVCDEVSRTMSPGTVHVTVTPRPPVKVSVHKSVNRPGQLKVVNAGDFRVRFEWGSYKSRTADGDITVRAHHSTWIHVRRPSLIWVAFNNKIGVGKIGIVRGITLPKGVHALPAGAPPAGTSIAGRARWAARWNAS
jgi:hypothetical protein